MAELSRVLYQTEAEFLIASIMSMYLVPFCSQFLPIKWHSACWLSGFVVLSKDQPWISEVQLVCFSCQVVLALSFFFLIFNVLLEINPASFSPAFLRICSCSVANFIFHQTMLMRLSKQHCSNSLHQKGNLKKYS